MPLLNVPPLSEEEGCGLNRGKGEGALLTSHLSLPSFPLLQSLIQHLELHVNPSMRERYMSLT